MIRINDIISLCLSHHPKADTELVERAYVYSAKAHQGMIRLSGEPYLSHPLEVAHILAQMKMDAVCITAGLLHDVLEDTEVGADELARLFGKEVTAIVEGVTKISQIPSPSLDDAPKGSKHRPVTKEQKQAMNFRKMLLAMSKDIRVILVKLADRLHNMRTLGFHRLEKQREISQETLDIYAPLAGRMGIYWMKSSLEDLCLYYLEPEIYEKINREMTQKKGERERFIKEVKDILSRKMEEVGIPSEVLGRYKHYYSIYRKMLAQNLDVGQVFDILAFRIIVDTQEKCYAALGHIHGMWNPVAGRIKDYISTPKANGYKSLHTTVIGPEGQRMEVQIRDKGMNAIAEEGIAAHWKYKEKSPVSPNDEKRFTWLTQLLEWQKSLQDHGEFIESVRMDLYQDELYVFTPRGELKTLPKGATPLDFAYSIHSEIGNHCAGARVNNRMVSIRYPLKTGEIVEIITSPKRHPSKNWIAFVKTPKAKNKIRQWLKQQGREESISDGRSILERALQKNGLIIGNVPKSEVLSAVASELSLSSSEELLVQLGLGNLSVQQVIGRLRPRLGVPAERPPSVPEKPPEKEARRGAQKGIEVKGISGMLMRFANCCHPLPGEKVVGFVTRGRGVTIHHKNCRHVQKFDQERVLELAWGASNTEVYQARFRVTSMDSKGILAEISAIITKKDVNILQAEVHTTQDHKGVASFTIELSNISQLKEILASVKKIKNVFQVERL